jgi:hypothetical protein
VALVNRTPSSTERRSEADGCFGVVDDGQMLYADAEVGR